MMSRYAAAAALIIGSFAGAGSASGQTTTEDDFVGLPNGGTANWTDGSNWSLGRPPTATDEANASFTDAKARTIDLNGGTAALLIASASGGGTLTLSLGSGESASFGQERIGVSVSGLPGDYVAQIVQTGGTHTANEIDLGGIFVQTGSQTYRGVYRMSGGTLSSGDVYLGGDQGGVGEFNQTGGWVNANTTVGFGNYSSGLYTLSGGTYSGTLYVGNIGNGTFNQIGGANLASRLVVGDVDDGNGTYSISGSSSVINTGQIEVGYEAFGRFLQSDGSVTTGEMVLGIVNNAEYNMSGGSLSVAQRIVYSEVAPGGDNLFSQTGGSVVVGSAASTGSIALSGGTLSLSGKSSTLTVFGDVNVGGRFSGFANQSGGTATVTGTVAVGSNGNYALSGGTLVAGAISIDQGGRFDWQAGSLSVGTLTVNGTMTLASYAASTAHKTLHAKALSIDNAHGSLDLTDNKLVVDYSAFSPTTTLQSVRASLKAAALFSSVANSSQRIGYGDNAILQKSSWGDQTFTVGNRSQVLAGLTYNGDVNLDGKVDIADLGLLATHWQQSGYWTDGDLNYDGTVDITDLGLLATTWQDGATGTQSFADALAGFNLSQVPEPSLLAAGAAALLLGRRQRRKTA